MIRSIAIAPPDSEGGAAVAIEQYSTGSMKE